MTSKECQPSHIAKVNRIDLRLSSFLRKIKQVTMVDVLRNQSRKLGIMDLSKKWLFFESTKVHPNRCDTGHFACVLKDEHARSDQTS